MNTKISGTSLSKLGWVYSVNSRIISRAEALDPSARLMSAD
jgi:hypothetical protein